MAASLRIHFTEMQFRLNGDRDLININLLRRSTMWTKPEVTEMRFGFEVTMYVCNR